MSASMRLLAGLASQLHSTCINRIACAIAVSTRPRKAMRGSFWATKVVALSASARRSCVTAWQSWQCAVAHGWRCWSVGCTALVRFVRRPGRRSPPRRQTSAPPRRRSECGSSTVQHITRGRRQTAVPPADAEPHPGRENGVLGKPVSVMKNGALMARPESPRQLAGRSREETHGVVVPNSMALPFRDVEARRQPCRRSRLPVATGCNSPSSTRSISS